MDKRVNKVLEVSRLEVVPEVVPSSPRGGVNILTLNLFDIDPYREPEGLVHIDLDLDQLEDYEE